jgi:hypothetical protein
MAAPGFGFAFAPGAFGPPPPAVNVIEEESIPDFIAGMKNDNYFVIEYNYSSMYNPVAQQLINNSRFPGLVCLSPGSNEVFQVDASRRNVPTVNTFVPNPETHSSVKKIISIGKYRGLVMVHGVRSLQFEMYIPTENRWIEDSFLIIPVQTISALRKANISDLGFQASGGKSKRRARRNKRTNKKTKRVRKSRRRRATR